MFYMQVCHMIIADDWMDLSFKVALCVGSMDSVCDYKRTLTPWFLVSSENFLLVFYSLGSPQMIFDAKSTYYLA
jgi:hypothetical protein